MNISHWVFLAWCTCWIFVCAVRKDAVFFSLNPWGGCKAPLHISRHGDLLVLQLTKNYQAELKWIAHHALFLSCFTETSWTPATEEQCDLTPVDIFDCIMVDWGEKFNGGARKDKFGETRVGYIPSETVLSRFHCCIIHSQVVFDYTETSVVEPEQQISLFMSGMQLLFLTA